MLTRVRPGKPATIKSAFICVIRVKKIVLRAKEATFTVDLHFAPIFRPLGPILANIVNQATFNKALLRPEWMHQLTEPSP